MSPNTAGAQIKQLKTFLKWCLESKFSAKEDFKKFTKPNHSPDIIALTQDELDLFFNSKFADKKLDNVRDAFIFSCVTSLRYPDYSRVGKDNIMGDDIVLHSQKTKGY